MFAFLYVFSVHIFKNYWNNKCVDLELTYFLECPGTSIAKSSRSSAEAICTGKS